MSTISTEMMARELRLHPVTLTRKARSKELPAHKQADGSWTWDRVEVFEAIVKDDVCKSLSQILLDPALPQVIRSNITTMIEGVRGGWLSVEKVGELMHAMEQ